MENLSLCRKGAVKPCAIVFEILPTLYEISVRHRRNANPTEEKK